MGSATSLADWRPLVQLGICGLVLALQLTAGYRKEQPVALVLAAHGAQYRPSGVRTWLAAKPGVFLFEGDMVDGAGGTVDLLWCPDAASQKFEYMIAGKDQFTVTHSPPPIGTGKELDVCVLPALERTPEVATLPSLDQMLPPPLSDATTEQDISQTPPTTAARLREIGRRDLSNPRIEISYATMLANAGLNDEAVDQFRELAKLWPDQPRIGRLILDLFQSSPTREIVHPPAIAQSPSAGAQPKGKTYALVIGIQKYEQDGIPDLLFTDADATGFADFMASDRGGNAEVVKLINSEAKVANIRNSMTDLLAKLRKEDVFVLFIAAHGTMQGDTPIVVTYRANPQDTSINGLPLTEIQKLRLGEKMPFRQVRVFLDICHAGNIALIEPTTAKGKPLSSTPPPPNEFLYLTATHQGPDAYAYEDPVFGHGVFTYFLLRGLESGEARAADNRFITASSLSDYVEKWVKNATTSSRDKEPRQRPTSLLGVPLGTEIADLNLASPKFEDSRPLGTLVVPSNRLGKMRRQTPESKARNSDENEQIPNVSTDFARRVALEDEGESILLKYLEGEEVNQQAEDFRRCADLYGQALSLQPGSPYLEARKVFCEGRALVFDKQYDDAIDRLERSIRLDPTGAYSFNALGIAYLETAEYAMARAAFQDAIERAPKWAYPRHNLALVQTQEGDYQAAVRTYRDAMDRAPNYSYLPYNLGLVFQRMNRLDEAETEYLLALQLANRNPPGRSEPYVALGALKASEKKWKDGESYYRKALTIPAADLTMRTARNDFAILLARNDAGWTEAEQLWAENGDYLPSLLAHAEALSARRQTADAISVYRQVLALVEDHLSSRLALAAELEKSGDLPAAISELRTALAKQPDNPVVLEQLAAAVDAAGDRQEAVRLYRLALSRSAPGSRAHIRKALKRLEHTP